MQVRQPLLLLNVERLADLNESALTIMFCILLRSFTWAQIVGTILVPNSYGSQQAALHDGEVNFPKLSFPRLTFQC
jgi:hypothetical protein